ncbi:MAG: response regulator, partial [Gemmatimonadaceae bacterium]
GRIDVLITDMMMPGMNGRSLAERLTIERPELRIVYMSGYIDETVSRCDLVDPTRVFLQKPFSGEQLAQAISEVLCAEVQHRSASAPLLEHCVT